MTLWLAAIAALISIGTAVIGFLPRGKSTPDTVAMNPSATPAPTSSPLSSPTSTVTPTPKPSPSSTPTPKPSPQPQPKTIVRESFTINARRFVSYSIPPNINGLPVKVTGRFEAQGGSDDIECYVLDADGFKNFKNGHRTGIYYNSGRATT